MAVPLCLLVFAAQVSGEGNPGAAAAAAGGGPEAGKGLSSQERAGFKAALLKVSAKQENKEATCLCASVRAQKRERKHFVLMRKCASLLNKSIG